MKSFHCLNVHFVEATKNACGIFGKSHRERKFAKRKNKEKFRAQLNERAYIPHRFVCLFATVNKKTHIQPHLQAAYEEYEVCLGVHV